VRAEPVADAASAADPLFLLPARYEDRTRITPLGALRHGSRAVVEGEVQLADVVFRRRRSLLVKISDGSGLLTLRFFHFSRAQQQNLARGTRLRCFGEARRGPQGLEMVHPEYRRLGATPEALEDRLTPIYPLTEGQTQGRVRMAVNRALARLAANPAEDLLPADIVQRLHLPTLREALEFMHHPPVGTSLESLATGHHPAQQRLAFEELLAHQLALAQLKQHVQSEPARALPDADGLEARFIAALPWPLTGAQRRVLDEVDADLQRARPMMRLVQGDVGSGKTAVAAAAAARAVGSGAQAALMAPTELLAEQHARTLDAWFRPLGLTVALLSGSKPARARRSALEAVASGEVHIAVGTHALFQQGVQFRELALAIVDEQHRFGVQQRLALTQKGADAGRVPHQLIMTATPIPRTLAMTAYADLDVSVIDELPPGRTPIRTVALPEERRADVVERIHAACAEGRQAYWVCTLIEESEELRAQAAEETATLLTEALPSLRIGLVHGRMPPKAKDRAMQEFKAGRLQLLVATTVIEVGVDVPNASLMVIENAERLGLAQLHQLRGRVGRGARESTCVLLFRAPLSPTARERLATLRDTSDGFAIAQKDLELRGPGELLGTRQTGLATLSVADLVRDAALLPQVRSTAESLLRQNAACIAPLRRRWIGNAEGYGRIG
jgi:ATP-dependent DNA helicase RecG